jgi:hypothetical protein
MMPNEAGGADDSPPSQPPTDRFGPPIPWAALSHVPRPPTFRYRALVAELLRANQASEGGDDDLHVVLKSLVSVLHFLDGDLIVRGTGLTRPLGILANALRDLLMGARPDLFFARPKGRSGRPKNISFEVARGTAAAALHALISWGESRHSAAKFVADELRRAGIKAPGGKTIMPAQILRWRDEIGGRASELTETTFKDVGLKYGFVPREAVADARRRRDIVKGSILAIRSKGF